MKKVAMALVVFLLVVAAGFLLFAVTFDANRYKSVIIESAQKVLNQPVELDRVSLGWQSGIALQVHGFRVYQDSQKKLEPGLSLEKASAQIKIASLFKQPIQISAIYLEKPKIKIVKNKDGRIKIAGIDPSTLSSGTDSKPAVSGASKEVSAPAFGIESFLVKNASASYLDESQSKPLAVTIRNLDIRVQSFSMTAPFPFKVDAAVFSPRQNIHIEGTVFLGTGAYLEKTFLRTDLAELDLAELSKTFEAAENFGMKENLKGRLEISADKMLLDSSGLAQSRVRMSLSEGYAAFKEMKSPIENIGIELEWQGSSADLKKLNANIAGGVLEVQGKIEGFMTPKPVSTFRASASRLSIADLMKEAAPSAPQLSGKLNFGIEGQAQGLSWQSFSKTLNGRARVLIEEGVFLNYNILREVIQKLSVIPGAEEAFRKNLPNAYQLRLQDQSTVLKPVDFTTVITDGVLNFNPLVLATDFLVIEGAGQAGLDKRIAASTTLRLNQEISQALIRGVSQVGIIANPRGEIEIPLAIDGVLPQVRILPDKQYIVSKLLSAKTQEVVADLVSDPEKSIGNIKGLLKSFQ